MKNQFRHFALFAALIFAACNKDGEITVERAPVIELDSQTGVYTVKVGREVTIAPTVRYADNAIYSWTVDGKPAGTDPTFTATFTEEGEVYATFRVETPAGKAEEELRIDVVPLAPPVICFAAPQEGLNLVAGVEYIFEPDVLNAENATFLWKLDGKVVGNEPSYAFLQPELGTYALSLEATNEDGTGTQTLTVHVLSRQPLVVAFEKPGYKADASVKSVALGRRLFLRPQVENGINPEYSWELNGNPIDGADGQTYVFTPTEKGTYRFTVNVTDTDKATAKRLTRNLAQSGKISVSVPVTVTCYDEESSRMRKATAGSSPAWEKVYEYLPAPGQFINDPGCGFSGNEKDMDAATAFAEKRLKAHAFVSLGGFGGYIIVGFDHSIENAGKADGYDFAIAGNQFLDSSEPGIVWVMQDTNGNGLPDDEWYELRGSETSKEGTIQGYSVTYYRPAVYMNTPWTDNRGGSGSLKYLREFHSQPSYYPAWVKEDSYTLRGTRLAPNNRLDPATGIWHNEAYAWGYADNIGEDSAVSGNDQADPADICFRIANAMNPDGSAAELQFIDFIKVQTGVNAQSGWTGEVSTEVFSFTDKNLQ